MIHDALLYDTDERLVSGTRDLIAGGMAAGDLVIVGGNTRELAILRDAWDDDPRLVFQSTEQAYQDPMTTLATYQRLSHRERAAGRGLRITSQLPAIAGPESDYRWRRYEAVAGRALAPYNVTALCRYDLRTATDVMVDHACAAHGRIHMPDGAERDGGSTTDELALVAAERIYPPLVTAPVVDIGIDSPTSLRPARERLAAALPPSQRSTDLLLAATEVATNALEHGGSPARLRLYRESDRWVCVVVDAGAGLDPYSGFDSPLADTPQLRGRGLWIARQMCDDLTISRRDGLTEVQLLLYR